MSQPNPARVVFTATERLMVGQHVVERGATVDFDPVDGSVVMAVRLPVTATELRDLLDRGGLSPLGDAGTARAVLSPEHRQTPAADARVIPIGPRLGVLP
jgi:hypothetical protein